MFDDAAFTMQVWQTAHPVVSELAHLGTKPMVHSGFYRAWTDRGLNLQIFGRIKVRCDVRMCVLNSHGDAINRFRYDVIRIACVAIAYMKRRSFMQPAVYMCMFKLQCHPTDLCCSDLKDSSFLHSWA